MNNKDYKVTVGLEIHAELKTKTKMFCNSLNDLEEKEPNVNICPICMGYPGTLPVLNKEAIRHVLKVGVAVSGKLADFSEFDRKNYFYPDIPKGYQISQYKYPLVSGGNLNGIEITRIHLEEDTARSIHFKDHSLVDFNRAGVPLMELVTEPVISNAKEAVGFAKELQLLLRYLKVSDADMEKGHMRVEANVSVSRTSEFGTKTEVKNLNSFRSVERAIEYEVERQIELIENGERVAQETRGWDEGKQKTFSQREKEESHDYRYFPEPDLPKLYLSKVKEFEINELKKEISELPWQKRDRYGSKFGIKSEDVEVFVADPVLADLFEGVAGILDNHSQKVKLASNYITTDILGVLKKEKMAKIPEKASLAELIEMSFSGEISSRGTKNILFILMKEGGKPSDIAKKESLLQQSNEKELEDVAKKILDENKDVAADYMGGKEAALQFLVGQGMKATKGSANPNILKKLFLKNIK